MLNDYSTSSFTEVAVLDGGNDSDVGIYNSIAVSGSIETGIFVHIAYYDSTNQKVKYIKLTY